MADSIEDRITRLERSNLDLERRIKILERWYETLEAGTKAMLDAKRSSGSGDRKG